MQPWGDAICVTHMDAAKKRVTRSLGNTHAHTCAHTRARTRARVLAAEPRTRRRTYCRYEHVWDYMQRLAARPTCPAPYKEAMEGERSRGRAGWVMCPIQRKSCINSRWEGEAAGRGEREAARERGRGTGRGCGDVGLCLANSGLPAALGATGTP